MNKALKEYAEKKYQAESTIKTGTSGGDKVRAFVVEHRKKYGNRNTASASNALTGGDKVRAFVSEQRQRRQDEAEESNIARIQALFEGDGKTYIPSIGTAREYTAAKQQAALSPDARAAGGFSADATPSLRVSPQNEIHAAESRAERAANAERSKNMLPVTQAGIAQDYTQGKDTGETGVFPRPNQAIKRHFELMNYDSDAANAEIEANEAARKNAALEIEKRAAYLAEQGISEQDFSLDDEYLRLVREANRDTSERDAQLRREIKEASDYQKMQGYYALTGKPDFEQKSERTSENNRLDKAVYDEWYGDPQKYVDALDRKHRAEYEEILEKYGQAEADQYLATYISDEGGYRQYNLGELTDEERRIFNYILNTEGDAAAEDYLKFMAENLNYRKALREFQNVQKMTGEIKLGGLLGPSVTEQNLYGFFNAREAGYDQFAQGLAGWLTDEEIPATSDMIENSLYNEAQGKWGRRIHSALTSGFNMLPSMIIGLANPTAGSVAFGISAGGNYRQEALKAGYTNEQATAYGILAGASEVLLEKLIGGMAGLGGKGLSNAVKHIPGANAAMVKISNALGRISIGKQTAARSVLKAIDSIGGEFADEYLQEILNPVFRNICLGEDNEFKPFTAEALEAGIVGALMAVSGNVAYAPSGVINAYTDSKNAYNAAHVRERVGMLIDNTASIDRAETAKQRDILQKKLDGGEKIDAGDVAVYTSTLTTEEIADGFGISMRSEYRTEADIRAQMNNSGATSTIQSEQLFHDAKTPDYMGAVALLRANMSELQNMESVASVTGTELSGNGRGTERAASFLEKIGNAVTRTGFGTVLFSKTRIKNSFVGHGASESKIQLFAAVPGVIQNGRQISYAKNWKNRGYDSYVFAAPVQYGNDRVFVSVVVTKGADNRYYLHEAVDENGNLLYGQKEENPASLSDKSAKDLQNIVADTGSSVMNIAQARGESQEGGGNLQADETYYNLSEDARTFFARVMQKNGSVPGAREAFYRAYLEGYTGRTQTIDPNTFISKTAQSMAYELGAEDKAAVGTFKAVHGAAVQAETAALFSRMAKDLNVSVTYGGKAPVVGGVRINGYITQTGAIHIFEDAVVELSDGRKLTGTDAARICILGHEVTHRLQQAAPGEYALFREMAVNRYGGVWFSQEYAKRIGLSEAAARDEMAADYAMEHLFTDNALISEITKRHSKLALAIRNVLHWIREKLGIASLELDNAIRLWNNAYNAAMKNKNASVMETGAKVKFSINPNFETVYDNWIEKYGRRNDMQLLVGTTSEALQSIGVKEQNIYWDTAKINASLKKHTELNDEIMKQVPDILENPVIIMESHSLDARIEHPDSNRIVMLGEVYGTDGVPIMAVLELEPKNKKGMLLQQIKLVSTYSKTSENISDPSKIMQKTQNLIDDSTILYIDPQKNRTNAWLRRNRLQLPFGVTKYGSINKVSYFSDFVNSNSMQKSEKDTDGMQASVTGTADIRAQGTAEHSAALSMAEQLADIEAASRNGGRRYTMSLDTFQRVANTYAGDVDKKTYSHFAKRLYNAAVKLAAAYHARGKAKTERYADAYIAMQDAAAVLERDRDAATDLAGEMTLAMLDAGYAGEVSSKTARERFMSAKQAAMDTALYSGRHTKSDQDIRLSETVRRKDDQIAVLLRDKQALRDKAARMRGEAYREYREKYAQWKAQYTENDTVQKARERIKKNWTALQKWADKPDRSGHSIPEAARLEILEMLSRIDVRVSAEGEAQSKEDIRFGERINRIADALAQYGEDEAAVAESLADDSFIPPAVLLKLKQNAAEIGGGSIYDMSRAELQRLDESLCIVKTLVARANELHVKGRTVELDLAAEAEHKRLAETKKSKTPGFAMNLMDSFTYADEVGGLFGDMIKTLQNRFDLFVRATAEVRDFVSATVNHGLVETWRRNVRGVTLGGQNVYMTDAQLMSLYLLNKRKQAREHIYLAPGQDAGGAYSGGIQIDRADFKYADAEHDLRGDLQRWLKETKDESIGHITEQEIDNAVGLLSEEQKKVADALQAYMAKKLGALGNEVSMRMYGYYAFMEPDYFPIRTVAGSNKTTSQTGNEDNLYAVLNSSMTKRTKEHAQNALVVSDIFSVFTSHASDMLNYYAYAEAVSDCMRVYNFKSELSGRRLSEKLNSTYPGAGDFYLNQLRALNKQKAFGATDADGLIKKLMGNSKAAMVGLNLRVVVQQPTAILRAMAVVDPKYFVKAGKKISLKTVQKYCPIAQWKSWGFYDMNIGRDLNTLLFGNRTAFAEIKEDQMWLAGKADEITWSALWNVCEAEIKDKHEDLTPGSEAFMQAVGKRLGEVINETQVVDTPFHRTQMARSQNEIVKASTAFMSEPMKSLNLLYRAKKRGQFFRAFAAVEAAQVLAAAFSALIDALRDDDDEKVFLEKYAAALGSNLLNNMNPLSWFPFAGEYLSHWSYQLAFGGVDKLLGTNLSKLTPKLYSSTGYEYEALDSFADAVDTLGNDNAGWYEKAYIASKAVSMMTGIGIENIFRDVVGSIYNLSNGLSPKGAYKRAMALGNEEKAAENYQNFLNAKCEEIAGSKYGISYASLSYADKKTVRKKAENSIKATTRSLFKDGYIKAWQSGDDDEITAIRRVLLATDLYSMADIKEMFSSYVKSYYKERYKEARTAEEKQEIIQEASRAKGRLTGDFKVFASYADAKKYLTE